MPTRQVSKKRQPGRERPSPAKPARGFNSDDLTLPQKKIRQLVVNSTTSYKIEPFVRQMIRVMDNIKAGQIRKVATLSLSRRDQSRAALITAISNAVRKGNTLEAHETAFMAALYAYENSLDHLRAFLRYLDGLRKKTTRRKRKSSRLR